MKLLRHGAPGAERPGRGAPRRYARRRARGSAVTGTRRFFGGDGLDRLRGWVADEGARRPAAGGRDPPRPGARAPEQDRLHRPQLPRPRARDRGALPKEPIVFLKATSALAGPDDDLVLPRGGDKTDWEVELGGRDRPRARSTSPSRGRWPTWPGSCCTTTTPSGRFRSSAAVSGRRGRAPTASRPSAPGWSPSTSCPDSRRARLWLKVNGELEAGELDRRDDLRRPDGGQLRFAVHDLAARERDQHRHASWGGPQGHKPPVFLRPGDVVSYGIDGLGEASQRIVRRLRVTGD